MIGRLVAIAFRLPYPSLSSIPVDQIRINLRTKSNPPQLQAAQVNALHARLPSATEIGPELATPWTLRFGDRSLVLLHRSSAAGAGWEQLAFLQAHEMPTFVTFVGRVL